MSDADGTYAKLMELSREAEQPAKPTAPTNSPAPKPPVLAPPTPPVPGPPPRPVLPLQLEDIRITGYDAHNFRFTDAETRWFKRFCLDLTVEFEIPVTHNLLVRLLLRVGKAEWDSHPERNRLRDLLDKLPRK